MLLTALRKGLGQVIVWGDQLTRVQPLQRSAEQQADVERELASMSLYQFHACPFCVKVRRHLHQLNLPIELRDAANDPTHRSALAAGGGTVKVPCLRIQGGEQDTWLYESDEIIAFLRGKFSA
ncbi:MAG: glutathione S-transferase N-terminal domain-containing protein [Pseudomonadota bacterium]